MSEDKILIFEGVKYSIPTRLVSTFERKRAILNDEVMSAGKWESLFHDFEYEYSKYKVGYA